MVDSLIARVASAVTLLAATAVGVGRVGSPGWGDAAELAAAAHRVAAGPPGYTMLAKLAALVPVGDVGFRIAVLSVVAVVAALAGVIALGRALVPDEPIAGVIAAAVAAASPAVGAAGATASTGAVVGALAVWAATLAVRARRGQPGALGAIALAAGAITVDPFAGVALLLGVAAMVVPARPRVRAPVMLGAGALAALAWLVVGASIEVEPGFAARLGALTAAFGDGRAAPLVLAGLVGLGLGALTGLRGAAGVLALAALLLAAGAVDGGGSAAPSLFLIAAGVAPVAGAVARALAKQPSPGQRLAIGAAASAPVALLALLAPAGKPVDTGDGVPATAVRAVIGRLPAGPGLVVLGSRDLATAARFEQAVAGERPDLAIKVRPDDDHIQRAIVQELTAGHPVGADVAAFGRLDPTRAIARGRGFQFLLETPPWHPDAPAPARWSGATGAALADQLALARASFEAVNGRLDAAARAAGLVDAGRFDAASLAILAVAVPTRDRPAISVFVPPLGGPPTWLRDVLGDDLAWLAGLEAPSEEALAAAPERRLHALWRDVLIGRRQPDDPAIAALGQSAEAATATMLTALGRAELLERDRGE